MKIYAATFERENWSAHPPIFEKVSVIFETAIPFENETIEAFCTVMWSAMSVQYPIWSCPYNQSNPPPNPLEKWRHGFSTPIQTGPIVCLNPAI